jgi:hypothetical protein
MVDPGDVSNVRPDPGCVCGCVPQDRLGKFRLLFLAQRDAEADILGGGKARRILVEQCALLGIDTEAGGFIVGEPSDEGGLAGLAQEAGEQGRAGGRGKRVASPLSSVWGALPFGVSYATVSRALKQAEGQRGMSIVRPDPGGV